MAISINTAGTWAYAASGSVTPTLPTHATGNMLIVRVAYKSSAIATCVASTATAGWAKVGEFVGTGNSGNGTGGVSVAAFWKQAASASDTAPQIDFSQTVTQVGHVAISYQKAAGELWATPVGAGGEDTTADTSKSMTVGSHVSTTAGDLVDFFMGVRDDCTMTSPTFTQTGVTFAAVAEQPAAAGTDTSGADGAYDGGYRLATAGTSSAAAVVTGTLNTNETGSAWTTRLRVSVATNASAGHASGSGSAGTGSLGLTSTAGIGTGTGSALAGQGAVAPNVGHATGSGVAGDGAGTLEVLPSAASGTGGALDATVETGAIETNADAELAAGIGAAGDSSLALTLAAGQATGTGAAQAGAIGLTGNAGHASGTGAAGDAVAGLAFSVGHATGTGVAADASLVLATNSALSSGAGAAFDATVSTVTNVEAPAEAATGTGQALDATVAIGPVVAIAAGSGIAYLPLSALGFTAQQATAAGLAFDATVSTVPATSANAGHAAGTGEAFGPTLALAIVAGLAQGTGSGYTPTILGTGAPLPDVIRASISGRRYGGSVTRRTQQGTTSLSDIHGSIVPGGHPSGEIE